MMSAVQARFDQPTAGRDRSTSPARVIGGTALMFVGVALMSYGTHFLTKTGNCSGTGYTEYGPVPKCSGGEALYIMSTFFVGPLAAIAGWLTARAWGWLWPSLCIGVGVALITLRGEAGVSYGAGAAALLGGICFFGLAVVSVIVSLRKRRRRHDLAQAAVPETRQFGQ
jgi:hypothetical protein